MQMVHYNNCSANSHGVKIKSPPHSAGQNYTLTLPSNIVNGQFLKTDANGNLSWSAAGSQNIAINTLSSSSGSGGGSAPLMVLLQDLHYQTPVQMLKHILLASMESFRNLIVEPVQAKDLLLTVMTLYLPVPLLVVLTSLFSPSETQ